MPFYLLLDLLGKSLILSSVGFQLLWLAPIASARDTNRQDFATGLLLANHQVNMVQLKAGNEKETDVSNMIALMWDNIKSAGIYQYAMPPEGMTTARVSVIIAFAIGSLLSIAGTFFEKRNKAAP